MTQITNNLTNKKILLFGSTGLLGQAITERFRNGLNLISPDRLSYDFNKFDQLEDIILKYNPDIVINCVALVNLQECENNREKAYNVNARSVAELALACNKIGAKLVHISTDHYFSGDGDKKHKETDAITILNYYAYSKFQAEAYALLAKDHLIIRTNIVGFRGREGAPTFIEWAISEIMKGTRFKLFTDYFTSSIDVYNFSDILFKALQENIHGLYNIGSRDVASKAEFIKLLSTKMGLGLDSPEYISINDIKANTLINRATSLGIDVEKIEQTLSTRMPNTEEVINRIIKVYYAKK